MRVTAATPPRPLYPSSWPTPSGGPVAVAFGACWPRAVAAVGVALDGTAGVASDSVCGRGYRFRLPSPWMWLPSPWRGHHPSRLRRADGGRWPSWPHPRSRVCAAGSAVGFLRMSDHAAAKRGESDDGNRREWGGGQAAVGVERCANGTGVCRWQRYVLWSFNVWCRRANRRVLVC